MYFFLSYLSSLIVLDFISHFLYQLILYSFLDILFDQHLPCWLPHFFCCFYIYLPLSLYWLNNSTVKGLLKIVFTLLFDYILLYVLLHCLIILWYNIIVLHCKYFLAGHIPLIISAPVVDVDTGTCSNFLSALLCILSI